ncbi:hypothetical protein Pfo_023807 [Paulownia fortunei]|nr:hypothetical protein Pfo_023807 [Paulownia fortunei]
MFPSGNSDNPLESLFKRSSFQLCDQNPLSKQDDSPFFSNFPSPFFDEHELPLNQILPQYLVMAGNHCVAADQTENNSYSTKKETAKRSINGASKLKEKADDQPISNGLVAPLRRRNLGVVPRKRTGKKDRHSKICTAQGIRDRRMRLSLQVARKFFDLQDMLGYDKASKTIEWLFNKSKKAIKELTKDSPQGNSISISEAKCESFLSECEVVSGIEESSNNEIKEGILPNNASPLGIKTCEKDQKKPQKTACKPNMRESRDKARARARCRTRQKMMIKRLENSSQWCKSSPNHNDLQKSGQKSGSSNSPFEGVDQESGSHNQERVSPYGADYPSLLHQLADVGTIEKLLGTSSLSTSCPISDYHCSAAVTCCIDPNSNFMGFLGNWDLLNNDRLNSSHYAVTNQVSLADNPNSVYSATTPNFPLFHQ